MVAVELYRVMKQIEGLEKKLQSLKPGSLERGEIEDQLRKTRSEKDRLKSMMEGAKD